MHLLKLFIALCVPIAALSGCSTASRYLPTPGVPFVHKIDVQQGNVVTQEMVGQLRIGMNKKKVRFVMGTPIIKDTFHSNRWDYLYTIQEAGGDTERHLVTAMFNDEEKLVAVKGNIKAAVGKLEVNLHQDTSVKVPEDYNRGIFAKLKDSMPFTGDGGVHKDSDEVASEDGETSKNANDDEASDEELEEQAELLAQAQAAENAVAVPEGARPKKKKGFFTRLVDAIGIGADEQDERDDDEDEDNVRDDRKYRDLSDPDS
ncbi:MAG: outer membrane protein assembly factor BamE [Gammaproteobacteria bacterium]|jgi:outer membrane protein assembly factor BamE